MRVRGCVCDALQLNVIRETHTCRKVITHTLTHTHTHTLTHLSSPAMPCMMRLSLVSVLVLSKQHTSTFPPKGMRKGSMQ